MRRPLVSLFLLALLVGACGGDDEASSDDKLRPADEVVGERASEAAADGVLGEEAELGDLRVTVSEPVLGGDDLGPWLEAPIRVENRGDDTTNPSVSIVCSGSAEEGGWQADSTFDLNADLPADTFNEGTIHLLLPDDGRYGESVPECLAPAVIRVALNGFTSDQEVTAVDFELPEKLITGLNAARQT